MRIKNLFTILIFSLSGCTENKPNSPIEASTTYFNQERQGYDKERIFQVDSAIFKESSHLYFGDTTYQLQLIIANDIRYDERIELSVYRKSDVISIGYKKLKFKCKNSSLFSNCEIRLTAQAEISKEHFGYIIDKISRASILTKEIQDFEGWKSFSDGGYSMMLQENGKFFVWGRDYVSTKGMIEIEQLWNELNNNELFKTLSEQVNEK